MFRTIVFIAFMVLAVVAVGAGEPLSQAAGDPCQIGALIDASLALGLPIRVERAFLLTLRTAGDACRQGEIRRVLTLLRTFSFEVRGVKRAKRLQPETADLLLARTEDAIRYLSNALHLQ